MKREQILNSLSLDEINKQAKDWAKERSAGDKNQDKECEYNFKCGMLSARSFLSKVIGGEDAETLTLKQRYERICNYYAIAFSEKQDIPFDGWIGGIVGGIAYFNTFLFDMHSIALDIDTNQEKGVIMDWQKDNPLGKENWISYFTYTIGKGTNIVVPKIITEAPQSHPNIDMSPEFGCPKDGRPRPVYITYKNKQTLAISDGNGDAYKVYGERYEQYQSKCLPENKYDIHEYKFDRGLNGMDF